MTAAGSRPCPYCEALVSDSEKACPACNRYVPGANSNSPQAGMSDSEKSFRIKAVLCGLAIIAVGICALIWPDALEDASTFGRHGMLKSLLRKCWGSTLGVALIIFGGLGMLGGLIANREDIDA